MPPPPPPPPPPSPLIDRFALGRELCFLNHGSYGACPHAVLEEQRRLRDRMEAEPVEFFVVDLPGLMDESRRALAAFVGCNANNLAFLHNASTGVATVLDNLQLGPGDEILATGHEYPACVNTANRVSRRTGAVLVMAALPFPVTDPQQLVDAVVSKATDRTKIALVSHVTSGSAVVMPVKEIVEQLAARGIDTVVDGAHAPGFVPLDVDDIGAAYYTANCHKWICAPKGAAFLHVRDDRRDGFEPLFLSVYAATGKPDRDRFLVDFDYIGTDDYTAMLSVPKALEVMGAMHERGWPGLMQANHELALRGRNVICKRLGVEAPVPDELLGPLSTILLPRHPPELLERLAARPTPYHDALQDELIKNWNIQVPIWFIAGSGERFVRIAAQVYNTIEQFEYLAEALETELAREKAI